jgi:hypothetical protein
MKEFKDKSSVLKKNSRYLQGGETDINKKRLSWWERFLLEDDDVTDIRVYISSKYAQRPDLVAFDYYGNAKLEWIVLQYNNMVDTLEEFTAGKTITIPSKDRVYFDILVNPIRVQDSRL